jgi:hypothetical protein
MTAERSAQMGSRDEERSYAPDSLMRAVALADVGRPIEHVQRSRADGRRVDVLRFRLDGVELESWLDRSFGPGGGPGRAWVTYENVRDVLGIDAVPTTWRLSRSKPAGLELERYLLIDDGEPATVVVAICRTLDALGGDGL